MAIFLVWTHKSTNSETVAVFHITYFCWSASMQFTSSSATVFNGELQTDNNDSEDENLLHNSHHNVNAWLNLNLNLNVNADLEHT